MKAYLLYTVEFADGPDAGDVRTVAHAPCAHRATPDGRLVPSPTERGYYRLVVVGPGYLEARYLPAMGAVTQGEVSAS